MSWTAFSETLVMVMIAEMGDRSQLACMVLGSRTRPAPVLVGAVLAFLLLDGLAVVLGGALGAFLPPWLLAGVAAALFFTFAVQAWRARDEGPERADALKDPSRLTFSAIFWVAFTTLMVAELGDKTWLAVGARSAVGEPISVWLGATLGLSITSAVGVLAGSLVLSRLPPRALRLTTAFIFALMGAAALLRAVA